MSQRNHRSSPYFLNDSATWDDLEPTRNHFSDTDFSDLGLEDISPNNGSSTALQSPFMDYNMTSHPSTPLSFARDASATPQPGAPRLEQLPRIESQSLNTRKPRFGCPVRAAENAQGSTTFSCGFPGADTMADVRRHMERKHVPFLKLCRTCNEHFKDKDEFEGFHGYKGDRCTNPQKQRRGGAAEAQWQGLFDMEMSSRTASSSHSVMSTRMGIDPTSSNSETDGSWSFPESFTSTTNVQRSTVDAFALYESSGSWQLPTQPPIIFGRDRNRGPRSRSIVTPYQLIVDSDSDEAEKISSSLASSNDASTQERQLDCLHLPELTLGIATEGAAPNTGSSRRLESLMQQDPNQFHQPSMAQELQEMAGESWHWPPEVRPRNDNVRDQEVAVARPFSIRDDYWSPYNTRVSTAMIPHERASQGSSATDDPSRRYLGHERYERTIRTRPMLLHAPDVSQLSQHYGPSSPGGSTVSAASSATPHTLICRGCSAAFNGEYRKGNLQRHMRLAHAIGGRRTYPCEADCGKSFNRQDARLKHYRRRHPELAPGDIIRRRA